MVTEVSRGMAEWLLGRQGAVVLGAVFPSCGLSAYGPSAVDA